jgi:hypothetical protein
VEKAHKIIVVDKDIEVEMAWNIHKLVGAVDAHLERTGDKLQHRSSWRVHCQIDFD